MLKNKVDLTEDGDFSRPRLVWTLYSGYVYEEGDVFRWVGNDQFTKDNFNLLYDFIFLPRFTFNDLLESWYIGSYCTADGSHYDFDYSDGSHCARCGKYLLPWQRFSGLCRECDEDIEKVDGHFSFDNLIADSFPYPSSAPNDIDIFAY